MNREDPQQTIDQLITRARRYGWIGVNSDIREKTLDLFEKALRLCIEHKVTPAKMGVEDLRKTYLEGCIDNSLCERALPWAEGDDLLPHRAYLLWFHQRQEEALECYQELIRKYPATETDEEDAFRAHTLLSEQGSLPPRKASLIEFWCSCSAIEHQIGRYEKAHATAEQGLAAFPDNSDLLCCLWRAGLAANILIPDPIDCLDDILGEGNWYVNTPWATVCAAELFERIEKYFEAGYLWHEFVENYTAEKIWSPELDLAGKKLAELSEKDDRIRKMALGELDEPVSLIV